MRSRCASKPRDHGEVGVVPMRVFTTVFVGLSKQNDDQSPVRDVDESHNAEELPLEFVSVYQGRNRVIVIDECRED